MVKRRGTGRATITDVAAQAGVSPITVSRALREPQRVSARLRARIDGAVRALDYVPDSYARALASSRSDIIGVLVPCLTSVVFADLFRGIDDAVAGSGIRIQLGTYHYAPAEEAHLLRLFLAQRPAALLVTGADQNAAARDLLARAGCPLVQVLETGPAPLGMMVGFSHHRAGHAVGEHLVAQGYRRIGVLAAGMDPRTRRRIAGCQEALAAAGQCAPQRVCSSAEPTSVSLGQQLLRRLLADQPDCDAVFCSNDDLALGAMFECQRVGLQVPQRFGIAGFNDLEMMAAAHPSLTSVRTPRYAVGHRAITMLLAAIGGAPPAEPVVDLGFELMARASTARTRRPARQATPAGRQLDRRAARQL